MPPAKKKPKSTTPRCSYKEGAQRCIKNATVDVGGIKLCGVHARVVAQAAQPVRSGLGGLGDVAAEVLDDVLAGRRVNKEKIATAINDFAWGIGGGFANYQPPVQDVPIDDPTGGPQQQQRRRNIWDDLDNLRQQFRGDWSRPRDPQADAREAEIKKARAILGFGPADAITPELLKARHRELSKKHHPDRGGSVVRMQEINAAVDTVAASL